MADHFTVCADKMSAQKRASSSSTSSGSESSGASKKAKRQVTVATFQKWKREYNREHQSLLWLRCDIDKSDKSLVATLWCELCRQHEDRIRSKRNFSAAWVTGSTNHRTSNILDHAKSEQHAASMAYMQAHRAKAQGKPVESYAPVARSLLVLDDREKRKMARKFEICYVLAREGLAFLKYPSFHALAVRQGVELGSAYKRSDCAKVFTHFIAEAQRKQFLDSLSDVRFFSFLMDGSTDAGNKEQELVLVLFCSKDDEAQEIRSCTRYLSVGNPAQSNAEGLIDCLGGALRRLGIDLHQKDTVVKVRGRPALVGGGTDGASVNIGLHNGMKAQMQSKFPWLFWAWCFSHRLELACKDALTSSLFTEISEMLLRLYYLYSKSPKKSKELVAIGDDLKEVFLFPKGGNLPVRSQGTRWISHKRKALQRVVDRFGAYATHLTALVSDTTIKSADQARLKGYLQKWTQGKMLVGCAMYIDVLKAPSLLSLSLQDDGVDIIQGIKHILKSADALQSLAKQDPQQWPTVKLVLSRVTDEGSQKLYQGGSLTRFTDSMLNQCSRQALEDLQRLDGKLKERLAWTDSKLLRSILVFVDTRNWIAPRRVSRSDSDPEPEEEVDDKGEIRAAAEHIVSIFREPLEAKGGCLFSLDDELEEAVDFCRKYLDCQVEDYKKVWYTLHSTHDARKWPNVLLLSELLFSLPFTNSKVERTFSTLKVVKTDRRTSLHTDTLDDLMEINVEGPLLENFSADLAVDLWWADCARRPNQGPRKEYRPREKDPESSTSDNPDLESKDAAEFTLDDWDDWFST